MPLFIQEERVKVTELLESYTSARFVAAGDFWYFLDPCSHVLNNATTHTMSNL